MIFTDLGVLVPFARLRANRDLYDGTVNERNMRVIRQCQHLYSIDPLRSAGIIYTKDYGHHTGGWWKNPDYERCLHLSISFMVNPTDAPLPYDKREGHKIAVAFFGDDARKCWVEPPYSPEGKHRDVHHYRLFCDQSWSPIIPRREVYSKDDTPAGWLSFSDLHGEQKAREADAPFLKGAST